MISLYESRAVNQFILHGNVNDRLYLPLRDKASLGGIRDFLLRVLLPQFDVILSYDLGNGIRVEKGGEIFSQWIGANEADQALGKRDSGTNDAGLSGRVYSMIAREMSDGDNRGKIIWVLASSRPDLIEVDLKRPGRVDVKIPIFPASTHADGFELLRALCKRRGTPIDENDFGSVEKLVPDWLTPGAAETLAVKTLRTVLTEKVRSGEALRRNLIDYKPPVARDVMEAQIRLAVNEASDWDFVPPAFRGYRKN